jgi:hypothetical protein
VTCNCPPTQALDRVERTLIDGRSRVVRAISLSLFLRLREITDDLSEAGEQDLADELYALAAHASRGMCTDCGSYADCRCDDMADQQATGGY